ncbi:hypothetical protein CO057_01110 [Candidatus Uhrbacteria bacterium CG_4_9_14_0_2_um_filter_41_50]|uniref:DDH domain-containing protein n=1 Tax=Candidatus Uhrbacteria bacterium CG_4_9_14_0_2_um_filter_41_50 TaxID=1975031 RepID=A0A2M8EPV3_9BACT|nr:MAG: hypothetical protein COZ45_02875 [Candidatus Uhrbacteria bacterium CG_4_10_14_3_um_filter_41_21]PIZ54305.1 MAG: hypothetical protein COY24_04265 [Candidatus Uhrbacteria bacterium CG_4_10_14_0_2_um_filter_41_21]PJB85060.1 MAG: hypothetical protein CO086_00325 [Candidatus Uhrbacteria bacterium CG_4_9_14_0_8_um_filter_41_16]PJC24754.1 MAG: hypothetical protein CO057_01110 [Candidatus Uhrbacteria bacterium CG_4_9_14_0_2_um_filter_41_50]PJE75355.1 MAG: hypothetical protein COV03_00530 [Candi
MALNAHEQFLTMLERSARPLIVLTENANADDFSSAFGVSALLAKLQKPVEIVSAGGRIPKSVHFLNSTIPVREDIKNIRKMTLKLNAKQAKVDELSYNMEGDELHIHILPKSGSWNADDVQIISDSYKYDLLITIGGADMESFGPVFTGYKEFFFQTPIINIDHNNANEHYGQTNLVDMSAVSCSEVCYDLFRRIDESLIDEEVATYFLTGMIFKTKSFRSENVTPKTLKVAGDLIAKGARRDEIIQKLYKTRSVETLRLWGRALARLKSDVEYKIVWTLLTRQDFANAGAQEEALENIIDELIMSAPDAKIAAVFFERTDKTIAVMLNAKRPFDALHLGAPFRAAGTREEALLKMRDEDIVAAEKAVITHIKSQVAELFSR